MRFTPKQLFDDRKNPLLKCLRPMPGFDLDAEGISSFAADLACTAHHKKKSLDRVTHTVTWRHAGSGLVATMVYVRYPHTNSVEINGRLTNRGKKAIRHLTGPYPLSIPLELPLGQLPRMTAVYGGRPFDAEYPPRAYRVTETDGVYSMFGGHYDGRSTYSEMPYIVVTDADESGGLFAALEWPCSWTLDVRSEVVGGKRHVPLVFRIAGTDFTLKPGQSVPIPRACLGFFRGDAVDGSNALRRHINENVRRDDSPPPVFYNHFFGMRRDWTVEDHLYEARVYAELGIEYYVVDAEWHKGDFRVGIGNWEIEDKRRFPDGMAAFADHVRALGMKFGSWIEIEWAMANSHWGRKHPDWFATIPGRYYHYGGGELQDRLLRVCDPKVRAAVADFLEQWVEKYGIEWVRWDMNNAPARFWALEDPKGQCGWGHLGYGEGLYALLDEFMRRCPQVHIESCAAGGHRMDLGTLRRGHSAWMSDKTDTHDVTRRIQTGLNRVLPGCYGNSSFIWATHPLQRSQTLSALKKDGYPPAALRSRMGGTLGFAENARFFTPAIKETLRQEIANYKVQRHLLMKDFYPLFDPRRLAEYDGWQFHDPETGEGFFQVFRCKAPQSQTEVRLRGLLPGLEYVLRDVDTRRQRNLRGGAAMRIRIADVDGVKWYQYHPA